MTVATDPSLGETPVHASDRPLGLNCSNIHHATTSLWLLANLSMLRGLPIAIALFASACIPYETVFPVTPADLSADERAPSAAKHGGVCTATFDYLRVQFFQKETDWKRTGGGLAWSRTLHPPGWDGTIRSESTDQDYVVLAISPTRDPNRYNVLIGGHIRSQAMAALVPPGLVTIHLDRTHDLLSATWASNTGDHFWNGTCLVHVPFEERDPL